MKNAERFMYFVLGMAAIVVVMGLIGIIDKSATTGDCEDVAVRKVESINQNSNDYTSGYVIRKIEGDENNVDYTLIDFKPISHTDTPRPVCPHCGKALTDGLEFTRYYSEITLTSKEFQRNYTIYEVRPDFYRCKSCNKDFTMTLTEEHLKHYTTEGVK